MDYKLNNYNEYNIPTSGEYKNDMKPYLCGVLSKSNARVSYYNFIIKSSRDVIYNVWKPMCMGIEKTVVNMTPMLLTHTVHDNHN